MASARAEAIAAMRRSPASAQLYVEPSLRPLSLGALLDAIPASVHARLAIESGGLEQVGWLRPPEHDSTLHRLPRTPAEAQHWGEVPVYRRTHSVREVVHACPPGDAAVTPCCGRTPFELPRSDRITLHPTLVTCRAAAVPAGGADTDG